MTELFKLLHIYDCDLDQKKKKSAIVKSEEGEKTEKQLLLVFQLEHTVVQIFRNKSDGWRFSDFPKNFRGGEAVRVQPE